MTPETPTPGSGAVPSEATEAIADALTHIRGPRGSRSGRPHHPTGPGRHDHRVHPGPSHTEDLAVGGDADEGQRRRSRGFGGPPAIVRLIEALVKSPTPLSVSELAEAITVDQPRASRLVQQGAAKGLLIREADPDDARRTRIALTEHGRHFAHGVRSDRREALRAALSGFSDAERADLARLLTKLADGWPA